MNAHVRLRDKSALTVAMQRLLLLMAAVRATGLHLIADIQSTETVASPMAAFWSAAVPRHEAVLGMLEFSYLGPRIGAVDPKLAMATG